ncbi:ABC transporter ATP-binding protein [Mariprofundus ferrooxydans]|uniref:Putative peptide ABC transporter, ATP-binding protein n=1 Tax=Mariprofundus ferrooxydans PV-1 TaxID=314345 RepID=Q0F3S9_9PROT|nr:oligopeptide/dipeptide ABC transporter ATP-binding protein [Mariprofundus ferrooxydans]EAU55862.1 putative peptide ABC transporter, ATP-binding protein [Mariprofundus ferrooxydans PV-1]KON48145.1 peptide ABC transporter ATP-binding protein [Mariprofundus ferrooxydans]
MTPILTAANLHKSFSGGGMFRAVTGEKRAVIDASFELAAGETLAIVGESGSGKSTTARMAMRLLPIDSGQMLWDGEDVSSLSARALRSRRHFIQMVFQDPFASLNPRMKIWESVAEGLRVHHRDLSHSQRRQRVAETLALCGLDDSGMDRYPHQFSGGQRQRIGIARALVVEPKVLVLDEPVSALDVSVQAQILNLLNKLQRDRGLSYLFISHDLSVVRHIADRVAVMFAGRIVETGSAETVFGRCRHPYTQALLDARPIAHPAERALDSVPVAADEGVAGSGCPFQLRCPRVQADCANFDCRLNAEGYACLHPCR